MKKKIVLSLCFPILLIVLLVGPVAAKPFPENYSHQDSGVGVANTQYSKPSEIVSMFPMSKDAEAEIVHVVPMCPVIIDGIQYTAEEIAIYNGQRLHFTVDKAGSLFAFTDAKAMEAFIENEYGPVFELAADDELLLARIIESELFEHWFYSGAVKGVLPWEHMPQLYLIGWDNRISSARITQAAPVTLWDYVWYGGDSFTMNPGSTHSILALEGWNDRASSIS